MLLYHYTVRYDTHLGGIFDAGHIDIEGTAYGCPQFDWFPSAAWFSRRTDHEPTAVKWSVDESGLQRRTPLDEYLAEAARVVIDSEAVPVMHWPQFCLYARNRPLLTRRKRGLAVEHIAHLERVGRRWGGDPADWYCSLTPVPLSIVEDVEVWRDGRWVTARRSSLGAAGTAEPSAA